MVYAVVYVKDYGNGERILAPLSFFADYKDALKCMNDAKKSAPNVAIVDADSVVWFGNDLDGMTVYIGE